MSSNTPFSVILPCKDEADSVGQTVSELRQQYPSAEILVVDDGSKDGSGKIAEQEGARVVTHPYSMGNGAAIKSGLREATCETIICMDADGQHEPAYLGELLERIAAGFDMAVGARSAEGQASAGRNLANRFYNRFAGLIVGHPIPDLTSGMRAFRKEKALEFLHLLPNGFSYPTTLTMAFFRAGYSVCYVPIEISARKGKSHISLLKDGVRFLLIIFKVGTLYSPLKVFFPTSVILLALGVGYYVFTFITQGRFTNMGALLLLSSLVVFLMGLVSEQITALLYSRTRQ